MIRTSPPQHPGMFVICLLITHRPGENEKVAPVPWAPEMWHWVFLVQGEEWWLGAAGGGREKKDYGPWKTTVLAPEPLKPRGRESSLSQTPEEKNHSL